MSANLLATAVAKVREYYGEDIANAVRACASVVAAHSQRQREHCLAVIVVGPSGKGKSVVINVFNSDRVGNNKFLHRVDDFTPASFVSHAANKKKSVLDQIDMLPKLADKTMLTKELAPLFRGDQKEMMKNFAVITAVMDGKGYTRQTGSQGERGYKGEYLFNWIGATTPFSESVYKLMGQLGNRFYFYELPSVTVTENELVEYAREDKGDSHLKECQKLVNDWIENHFANNSVKSIDPASISISDDQFQEVVRYAQLIAAGRVEVTGEYVDGFCRAEPEGPHRIILSLKMLLMGSAIADGRAVATDLDMKMIRHVTFSTIPDSRRKLLRAVLLKGGTITTTEVRTTLRVSDPTALNRMRELSATGITTYYEGNSKTSTPASIELAPEWKWLL